MALRAAVRASHPTDEAFRCPVSLLQDHDGPAPEFRAQMLLSARSLRIAFSSSASARSFHCFAEAFGLERAEDLLG